MELTTQVEQTTQAPPKDQARCKEGYNEPLLLKHEPLRDITGFKYGEKRGLEKPQAEAF